jgi:hypothetical protein
MLQAMRRISCIARLTLGQSVTVYRSRDVLLADAVSWAIGKGFEDILSIVHVLRIFSCILKPALWYEFERFLEVCWTAVCAENADRYPRLEVQISTSRVMLYLTSTYTSWDNITAYNTSTHNHARRTYWRRRIN